jgi:hypothetical protein
LGKTHCFDITSYMDALPVFRVNQLFPFRAFARASEDRIPPSDGIICLLGSLDNQNRSNSDVETSRIPISDPWEKLWLGQIGHTGCKRVAIQSRDTI